MGFEIDISLKWFRGISKPITTLSPGPSPLFKTGGQENTLGKAELTPLLIG